MSIKTKAILKRFVKGFVAGAVASMLTVAIPSKLSFPDIKSWFYLMLLAGITGGVTGLLLAIQKALSWKE